MTFYKEGWYGRRERRKKNHAKKQKQRIFQSNYENVNEITLDQYPGCFGIGILLCV